MLESLARLIKGFRSSEGDYSQRKLISGGNYCTMELWVRCIIGSIASEFQRRSLCIFQLASKICVAHEVPTEACNISQRTPNYGTAKASVAYHSVVSCIGTPTQAQGSPAAATPPHDANSSPRIGYLVTPIVVNQFRQHISKRKIRMKSKNLGRIALILFPYNSCHMISSATSFQ
jgi:hypothetical protein